jgi:hypothetical protein
MKHELPSVLTAEQRIELIKLAPKGIWGREWLGAAEAYLTGGLPALDAYVAALPPEG